MKRKGCHVVLEFVERGAVEKSGKILWARTGEAMAPSALCVLGTVKAMPFGWPRKTTRSYANTA
jgi:hypothetical protein